MQRAGAPPASDPPISSRRAPHESTRTPVGICISDVGVEIERGELSELARRLIPKSRISSVVITAGEVRR